MQGSGEIAPVVRHHTFLTSLERELQEVVRTIQTDLGRPLQDIFENFGQKPIASASVGQAGRRMVERVASFASRTLRTCL